MPKVKSTYILEHNNPALWRQVKSCAAAEGVTVKNKILCLLKDWIKRDDGGK